MIGYCNTFVTNAPVICVNKQDVEIYAKSVDKQLLLCSKSALIEDLSAASKSGKWILVDACSVSTEELRTAVYFLWLKAQWDHHENFRAWFLYPSFMSPLTGQYVLLPEYAEQCPEPPPTRSLSPPTDDETYVCRRLVIEEANEHLPAALICSAVFLKYTDCFAKEFPVRELINAVADMNLFRVRGLALHLLDLTPERIIGLFRLCRTDDVFFALLHYCFLDKNATDVSSECIKRMISTIVAARDRCSLSLVDVAFAKHFLKSSLALQSIGCFSGGFDFNLFSSPDFRPILTALIRAPNPLPFDAARACQHIVLAGEHQLLSLFFSCGCDQEFSAYDYPLAEACFTDRDDVTWLLLDRMSAVGVAPWSDDRFALFHLLRIVSDTAVCKREDSLMKECTASAADKADASTTAEELQVYELSSTALWVAERLCTIVEEKGHPSREAPEGDLEHTRGGPLRQRIPLLWLYHARSYPRIMRTLLDVVDIDAEQEPMRLLALFIKYYPGRSGCIDLLRRAFLLILKSSKQPEEEVFQLLWSMFRSGDEALDLALAAESLNRKYGVLDYCHQSRADGDTILHKAMKVMPPSLQILHRLLSAGQGEGAGANRVVDAENSDGLSCLQWVVSMVSSCEVLAESEAIYAEAVRILLHFGASPNPLPEKEDEDLFTVVSHRRSYRIALPLFHLRKGANEIPQKSIVFFLSTREIGGLYRAMIETSEHSDAPKVGATKEQRERASDVLAAIEKSKYRELCGISETQEVQHVQEGIDHRLIFLIEKTKKRSAGSTCKAADILCPGSIALMQVFELLIDFLDVDSRKTLASCAMPCLAAVGSVLA